MDDDREIVTEEEVAACEAYTGYRFPEEYRRWVLTSFEPFPARHNLVMYEDGKRRGTTGVMFYRLHSSFGGDAMRIDCRLAQWRVEYPGCIPDGAIPIGSTECAEYVMIQCKGQRLGEVWLAVSDEYIEDDPNSWMHFVARNFDEFLRMLQVEYPGEDTAWFGARPE